MIFSKVLPSARSFSTKLSWYRGLGHEEEVTVSMDRKLGFPKNLQTNKTGTVFTKLINIFPDKSWHLAVKMELFLRLRHFFLKHTLTLFSTYFTMAKIVSWKVPMGTWSLKIRILLATVIFLKAGYCQSILQTVFKKFSHLVCFISQLAISFLIQ